VDGRTGGRADGRTGGRARSAVPVPGVTALREALCAPVVPMGPAVLDGGMQGPGEKMHLPAPFRGIEGSIRVLHRAGAARTGRERKGAR
jgi:hypothetical protein